MSEKPYKFVVKQAVCLGQKRDPEVSVKVLEDTATDQDLIDALDAIERDRPAMPVQELHVCQEFRGLEDPNLASQLPTLELLTKLA